MSSHDLERVLIRYPEAFKRRLTDIEVQTLNYCMCFEYAHTNTHTQHTHIHTHSPAPMPVQDVVDFLHTDLQLYDDELREVGHSTLLTA